MKFGFKQILIVYFIIVTHFSLFNAAPLAHIEFLEGISFYRAPAASSAI